MSAGHCGNFPSPSANPDVTAARFNWDSQYGTNDGEMVFGRVDAERIVRSSGSWSESSSIWLGDEPWRPINHVLAHANVMVGTTVAYSGRTSSTTRRGPVTFTNAAPTFVPSSSHFIVANTCGGMRGDSGAPLFRNNSAVGILSGDGGGFGCTSFGSAQFAFNTLNVFLIP